ncbi:MAG: DUF4332 domain-containing protein [Candidatus Thorarchaeota archaeon]|nr:DUF4332 domain-containing protein [Candidatus Thorarchaeota archaeon]MCK5239214.1 DUF4332 domain-containing protein [Candidatus Thorarchaeota archaeon]
MSGLSSNRKFLIAVIIGAIIGVISLLMWRVDQTISLGLLAVAVGIPIVVYVMLEDEIDLEDLLDEEKAPEKHVEEYVPEVEEPTVAISDLPIETIEGIGEIYGKLLRDAGIITVADLNSANATKVAEICDVNTEQAERWIAMSHFAWLNEISEEDAEAIVFATGMTTLKELSGADASDVLSTIEKSVKIGKVRVPEGYEFTLEKVKAWISAAKKA